MSPDIVPVLFTPDTGTVDKLVISVLVPTYRPTIGSQYQQGYLRRLIEGFTFVQLLYLFLTDFSTSLSFQPFSPDRSIPTPWKGSTAGWIGNASSKAYPRGQPSFQGINNLLFVSLLRLPNPYLVGYQLVSYRKSILKCCLSSHLKLWWINFQRTILLIRNLLILKSVLIHRRSLTHPNNVYKSLGVW